MFIEEALRLFAMRGMFLFGLKDGHSQLEILCGPRRNLSSTAVDAVDQLFKWTLISTCAGFFFAAEIRNRWFLSLE